MKSTRKRVTKIMNESARYTKEPGEATPHLAQLMNGRNLTYAVVITYAAVPRPLRTHGPYNLAFSPFNYSIRHRNIQH